MNIRDFPVMAANCTSCPFRDGGDAVLRCSIESRIFKASQVCHHPRTAGKKETHLCRGARDYQQMILHRLGFLSAPTDEAWEAKRKETGA